MALNLQPSSAVKSSAARLSANPCSSIAGTATTTPGPPSGLRAGGSMCRRGGFSSDRAIASIAGKLAPARVEKMASRRG
jgi:hypothetical protein